MIDPHWLVEDLDPRTWRAIGRFFMPAQYIAAAQPGEHGLFVLHDGGQHPRVVDDQTGPRPDLRIDHVDDPRALALELHERAEWDRVHVIDRRHLAKVARVAQATPRRELTLDAYYHLVYELIWSDGSDGYVCVPPHPGQRYGVRYGELLALVRSLPSPSSVGLCVLDGAEVEIGLVLGFRDGRIVRVTTLEGLPPFDHIALDDAFVDALWRALEHAIAPPAAVLVCTRPVFEEWLAAPLADKPALLASATRRHQAVWRTK
jgi:hypothetical protein